MKTEDIDKKIGMPNVDEEWAKFEREVIGEDSGTQKLRNSEAQKLRNSRTIMLWGLSIAASIALVAGIFLFGNDDKEQQEKVAAVTQQPAVPVPHEEDTIISEVEQFPDANLLAMETPKKTEKTVTKIEAPGNPTAKEDGISTFPWWRQGSDGFSQDEPEVSRSGYGVWCKRQGHHDFCGG